MSHFNLYETGIERRSWSSSFNSQKKFLTEVVSKSAPLQIFIPSARTWVSHHNWSDALLFQRHFAMNNWVKSNLKEHSYSLQCVSLSTQDQFFQFKLSNLVKTQEGDVNWDSFFRKNFIQLWHNYHYYPAQWNSYTCLLYFPIEKRKWLILTIFATSSPNQIRIIAVTRVCFVSMIANTRHYGVSTPGIQN